MLTDLFNPLGQQYCAYFYYLSIIFFVISLLAVVTVLNKMFNKKKGMKLTDAVIIVTQPLLLYFINRLYYSMCVGSLN